MVDFSFLESFTKGNRKKINRYIGMYLSMAPQTFSDLESQLSDGDLEAVKVIAHSLKPQAEFMGIQGLKELLEEIEVTALAGDRDALEAMISLAKSMHEEALPILEEKASQA
jgi:HPt (histidine-containing phosphotransfer) domain-containing protein